MGRLAGAWAKAESVAVRTTAASTDFIAAVYEKQIPYANDKKKSNNKNKGKSVDAKGAKFGRKERKGSG
jgi:hypothetical protein